VGQRFIVMVTLNIHSLGSKKRGIFFKTSQIRPNAKWCLFVLAGASNGAIETMHFH